MQDHQSTRQRETKTMTRELTVGSVIRVTRSITKNAPDQPVKPGSIDTETETFVGEVTSVFWSGNRQRGIVEEIVGKRRQLISYPPLGGTNIKILKMAYAPDRRSFRFGVPVGDVVRGKWDASEWVSPGEVPEDGEVLTSTSFGSKLVYREGYHGPIEHIAEWNGEKYVVERADRKYHPWEIKGTLEGDVFTELFESDVLLPSLPWSGKNATEAYRSEMNAVARVLQNAL